jgi:hypothetical protein
MAPKKPNFKDRIQELIKVKASDLRGHPDNWRLHPAHQVSALNAVMEEIGLVSAVIARRTEDGLQLIDGHLRSEILGDDEVSVLIVDLNDQEAAQMLATFDPIGELALTDNDAFSRLIPDLGALTDHADLRLLLDQIHTEAVEQEKKGEADDHYVAGMQLEPHEHYDYIVVSATSTHEWNVLCTKLGLEASKRRNRVGAARGISAKKLLDILGDNE